MHVPGAIGRYPVTGVIGTGAFSAVYRAIDERLGSEVAIKLLGDHHSLDADIRERFISEARLLRRVNSPYVVRLFELDETERHQPYLVLELVQGGNLSTHRRLMVGRGLTVTRADVATVAAAVREALTALHAERIVHRDLSPTNLLLRRGAGSPAASIEGLIATDEQLVLADLGLSKDLALSSGLTAAAGTEGFAAPEQRAGRTVDERTDVFAASALLTWFILGEPPSETDAARLDSAGWHDSFTAVLESSLAEDPARRPTSIAAWHDAVVAALQPPAATTPAPVEPADGEVSTASRGRKRQLIAVAIAAVIAGGAGYGSAVLLDDGDGEPGVTITELEDNIVRVEHTVDGVTAAFEGPRTLVVDEKVTYQACPEGAATWTWFGPGGTRLDDDISIDVTPLRSGTLVISLVATARSGEAAVADLTITVLDAPAS